MAYREKLTDKNKEWNMLANDWIEKENPVNTIMGAMDNSAPINPPLFFSAADKLDLKEHSRNLGKVYELWLDTLRQHGANKGWDTMPFWGNLDNHAIITGGCLASMHYGGEDVKDYDIYFTNKDTMKQILKFYLNEGSYLVDKFGVNEKYAMAQGTAIDLKVGKIQLITFEKGETTSAIDIVNRFDYLHTKWYYKTGIQNLMISPEIWKSIKERKLYLLNDTHYDKKREQRFVDRGWTVEYDAPLVTEIVNSPDIIAEETSGTVTLATDDPKFADGLTIWTDPRLINDQICIAKNAFEVMVEDKNKMQLEMENRILQEKLENLTKSHELSKYKDSPPSAEDTEWSSWFEKIYNNSIS